MIRSPDDGVQLETHQAQSGSSSVGVPPATGGSTSCETPPENVPIPGPPLIDITTEAGLATDQPNQAARSAGATTSGSKAVNEDSENMPNLTDGRFSIRAEAVVETKDLRELTGNRHRQDSEHVRYLREHGDADTPASDLLGRDGTQPAPNPRRNVSEAGVPGVLPRPDQPGGTSSNRLTIHPERKIDETRHPKLANWASAEAPEEVPGVTTSAPGHRVVPTTPCGDSEAQEATVLARKDLSKASGQFKVQSAAAEGVDSSIQGQRMGTIS